MDLIGPLRDTANKNQYILTMTDLYTKWVVADALQTKSGTEVATAIVSKLYLFGMVRKIITNQGKALVNEVRTEKTVHSSPDIIPVLSVWVGCLIWIVRLTAVLHLPLIPEQLNRRIFEELHIKRAVSSAYHPDTCGQVSASARASFLEVCKINS